MGDGPFVSYTSEQVTHSVLHHGRPNGRSANGTTFLPTFSLGRRALAKWLSDVGTIAVLLRGRRRAVSSTAQVCRFRVISCV